MSGFRSVVCIRPQNIELAKIYFKATYIFVCLQYEKKDFLCYHKSLSNNLNIKGHAYGDVFPGASNFFPAKQIHVSDFFLYMINLHFFSNIALNFSLKSAGSDYLLFASFGTIILFFKCDDADSLLSKKTCPPP